jgi:hypothetical protein
MLEHERSALIRVALQARLLIAERLIHHARPVAHSPGGRIRTVRIVAVGTLHETLVHSMLEGHRKLRSHI